MVGDWDTSDLDCLIEYLNTAPACVSVVWFQPKVTVDFSRAFDLVCALLVFPDRHNAFGAKHLQVSNAPWVWRLKNSAILRAQGIMLQFRTLYNLESQVCKENLTPGFWKHLKHLRQKSQ